MIDYLKIKFNEEAVELITGLEQALLELEEDPYSGELINKIFRALHTLKGSGAMFGYAMISDFTHHLENLYDKLRNNTFKVSREIMDITFESIDLIRRLLYNQEDDNLAIKYEIDKVVMYISRITGDQSDSATSSIPAAALPAEDPAIQNERKLYIRFVPGPDILKNGNNPLYLLDELYLFGECSVKCCQNTLPGLDKIDIHRCYYSWDIELTTSVSKEEIKEVFLFVEDSSVLSISEEAFCLPDAQTSANQSPAPVLPEIETDKKSSVISSKTAQQAESSIRVSSGKLDQLMNLVSELVTMQARLDLLATASDDPEAALLAEALHKLNRQLRDTTFEICMIPIQSIVTRFSRLVRDLSKEMNKEIVFTTQGMDTELDKNIIENITDPLLHILRNCIDHGIETPEKRKNAGKPATGTIHLKAWQAGPNVVIEVSDDGAGIDPERVYQKAVEKKLIKPGTILNETETIELLLQPGFSTTDKITSISGRGVGLDVVKQQVNALRGVLHIHSENGKGTKIQMELPMVLSIIDGLLVNVSGELYIIPLDLVRKIIVYDDTLLSGAYHNLIAYNNKKIPFISIRHQFDLNTADLENSQVIIVNYKDEEVGIAVDKVIGKQQVVIKPLGKLFQGIHQFSGATILGDGSVALVIDINRMINEIASTQNNIQKR
jgi:two-component system chemotaxis sensor kinase CheA